MTQNPNVFIAYEPQHIDEACVQAERGAIIICLDFLVERMLKKKNVPCLSLKDFTETEIGEDEIWQLSHEISREWYRLPAMKFFEYDEIRLAEAPEPIMGEYLARLLYYARIFTALKKVYPEAHFTVPNPVIKDGLDAVCLASFHPWAVVDGARMACLKNITHNKPTIDDYTFSRSSWKPLFIRVYNVFISLVPSRPFKIYASGYWTHLEPVVSYVDGTELMLLESEKFYKIPLRLLLKHRIRIFYSHGFVSNSEERKAREVSNKFIEQWQEAKNKVADYLAGIRRDFDWRPVLEACEYLINYAPRVIADIRILDRVMKKERPDVILQMASTGGPQHYFFLMARVASQLGIPSVELQHAGATIDPRSVYCRIETDYLATYGESVNTWHQRLGHQPKQLISVGSPRFDRYVNEYSQGIEEGKRRFIQLGLDPMRPVLLVAVPFSDALPSALDSYQLADFFKVISEEQNKVSGLQILFKFRHHKYVGEIREYLEEIFRTGMAITGNEDIFPLLCASDAVVCNNSTVIYQAVLAKKPLILYPWKHFDTYHAEVYAPWIPLLYDRGEFKELLSRLFTETSYREELLKRQKHFLEGYSFDGKSSRRVAKLLLRLPSSGRE